MLRNLLSVVGGAFVGMNIGRLLGGYSAKKYPMPDTVEPTDPEAYFNFLQSLPSEAFYIILAAHALGSFVAAIIAGRIAESNKKKMAMITVFVMFVLTIALAMMVPNPRWFVVSDIIVVLLAGWIGTMMVK